MHFPSVDDPHIEDGFTGNTRSEQCRACGRQMVSREYKFGASPLWSTVHDTDFCRDLASKMCRGSRGAIGKKKKVRQPAGDME